MGNRLTRLLHPQSIAIFGGKPAHQVVEQCLRMGYAGNIWPVHPRLEHVHGYRCFRSADELPGSPDAAFVAVNRHASIDIVRALAQCDSGGVICYASGFREAEAEIGDGAALEAALLDAAAQMPLIGPNCYGFINFLDATPLWPDQHGGRTVASGVAIVTQSSNIAINLSMQQRGVPIAYLFTVGNQAQLGLSAIGDGLLDDPRITALGFYIEGFDDPDAFAQMAVKARQSGKPIVVIKSGRSDQAQGAVLSHTASLAGSDPGSDAFLASCGVARVRSLPVLLETLKLLHVHGPLSGPELCSMSCSGGEAALIADAAVGRRIRFRPLSDPERTAVKATLNDMVTIKNPLDYHTFIWGNEEKLYRCFAAMIGNGFNLSLLVLDFPRGDRCDDREWDYAINALSRVAAESDAPIAVVATMAENLPEHRALELHATGIASLCGVDTALDAAEAAWTIGHAWSHHLPSPSPRRPLAILPNAVRTWDESAAKTWLRQAGVPVPNGEVVSSGAEAVTVGDRLGYPLAAKTIGRAHKSDVNGVRLNLRSAADLGGAVDELLALNPTVLVERMIDDGIAELLVGISVDPVVGLMLTLGAGGVWVELLNDTVTILLPARTEDIQTALQRLRVQQLLIGYRGGAVADATAAVVAIDAVAQFAFAQASQLVELEVNPLIVRPEGYGVCAVDVLLRTAGEG